MPFEDEWLDVVRDALAASDEAVGPACMNVAVPATINMSDSFREAYEQGFRHALAVVRQPGGVGRVSGQAESSQSSGQRAVWKFALDPYRPEVEMPQGATMLNVHEQKGQVCVWAEVDTQAETTLRKLYAVPTGGVIPPHTTYLGTAHFEDVFGTLLVIHVYDGGEA